MGKKMRKGSVLWVPMHEAPDDEHRTVEVEAGRAALERAASSGLMRSDLEDGWMDRLLGEDPRPEFGVAYVPELQGVEVAIRFVGHKTKTRWELEGLEANQRAAERAAAAGGEGSFSRESYEGFRQVVEGVLREAVVAWRVVETDSTTREALTDFDDVEGEEAIEVALDLDQSAMTALYFRILGAQSLTWGARFRRAYPGHVGPPPDAT